MPSYEAVPPQAGFTYSIGLQTFVNNTKGPYTQLVAATGIDCAHFWVTPIVQSTNQRSLIDIATGAAASEVILVADFMYFAGNASNQGPNFNAQINADIPTGTRLAARIQQDVAFALLQFTMMLIGDNTEGLAAPTTYGAFTVAATTGTNVDPGALSNLKGAYFQITASTVVAHEYITTCFGDRTNPTIQADWAMDVAIGAAASEVIILPDIKLRGSPQVQVVMHGNNYWVVDQIPSTTRLAVRGACSSNAGGRLVDCILICGEVPTVFTAGGGSHVF